MREDICKCCGQTLPFPFEVGLDLSKGQRDLIDAVYLAGAHGIHTDRLIHKIYGDDPNGGPDDARKTIHVRISQANKKLRERGWNITARGDHQGIYVLEKLMVDPVSAVTIINHAMGRA